LRERGDRLAEQKEWEKAAADYARAFEAEPPRSPYRWFDHAYMRLQVGDAAGYRKLCGQMRARFGGSKEVDDIALLAHACVLAPDALGDASAVVRLAEQRLAMAPRPSIYCWWSAHVLGLAYYRARQHQKAVDWLNNKAVKECPDEAPTAFHWLVLAMAHQ
jgi:hypothetical protein